jgi:hypothetical protein
MRALLIGLPPRRMWLLALPMVAAMAFVSHTVSAKGKRAAGSGAAAEFFFDGSDIRVEFRGVVSN